MIIDFHTHIFPDKIAEKTINYLADKANIKAYGDGTLNSLLDVMNKGGIDYSVTLPIATKPEQVESINRFAVSLNDVKEIIPFGTVHPEYENWRCALENLKASGIKGIKLHPEYQDFFIDDEKCFEICKYASELDLTVVFHSGVDLGFLGRELRCTPKRAYKLIKRLNYEKLVFAHMGASDMYDDTYEILAGENIFFDTGFCLGRIPDEKFLKLVEKHGADKILFATDFPWHSPKKDSMYLKLMSIDNEKRDMIFYKNAVKLLNIKEG